MFSGLLDPDPDPLVRGMDPDPECSGSTILVLAQFGATHFLLG